MGYIRGPEAWIVRLGRFKALSDLGGPLFSQAVAALLLDMDAYYAPLEVVKTLELDNPRRWHRDARCALVLA